MSKQYKTSATKTQNNTTDRAYTSASSGTGTHSTTLYGNEEQKNNYSKKTRYSFSEITKKYSKK